METDILKTRSTYLNAVLRVFFFIQPANIPIREVVPPGQKKLGPISVHWGSPYETGNVKYILIMNSKFYLTSILC